MLSIEKPNIRILKNRAFGTTGYIICNYDPTNRRIFQSNVGDGAVYGWDHTGIKPPEHQAYKLPEFAVQIGQPETGANYLF